jgi:hypothetical protein
MLNPRDIQLKARQAARYGRSRATQQKPTNDPVYLSSDMPSSASRNPVLYRTAIERMGVTRDGEHTPQA